MAATNGTVVGQFPGTKTGTAAQIVAGAFTNPKNLDILQVVNEGGKVVWNLDYAGVASANPAAPSKSNGNIPTALIAQMFGSTLAAAMASNPGSLDILQITQQQGGKVILYVNAAGTVTTP